MGGITTSITTTTRQLHLQPEPTGGFDGDDTPSDPKDSLIAAKLLIDRLQT
ncbi:MAG: hypothetical protein VKM92_04245 [Cyanobacteriota bacterium]|nr:hypothetical protein [Cyanobacteriota bacterium]